tara:strand:- start:12 stop:767 length:756 start_codon:yes stop_codon:yes gene_type:complete
MLGATLAVFSETAGTNKTVEERFNDAVSVVDVLLGIDSKTGVPVPFDNSSYRGQGVFRQKRTKDGKVLFVRDSGVVFNGITSIEINDRLTGMFGAQKKNDARAQSLKNLIMEQVEDDHVSASDYINFLEGKSHNNRFLNHLETEHFNEVSPIKIKNDLKQSISTSVEETFKAAGKDITEAKKKALQWGADEWCDNILGPTANGVYGKSLSKQAFGVCMKALTTQAESQGVPLHMFLLDRNDPRIQKFIRGQ